jgi:hypothetical protein
MNKRQRDFVKIFIAKDQHISDSCAAAGITRRTYYNWLNDDPEFFQAIEEAKESFKDFVEKQIIKHIKKGDKTMLIYYSKTQLKDRGYIERQELAHSGDLPVNINVSVGEAALKGYQERQG